MPCHFLLEQPQLPRMPISMPPNLKTESYSITNAMSFFVESAAAADDADFEDASKLQVRIVFRH